MCKMKKLVSLLLMLSFILCLASCGGNDGEGTGGSGGTDYTEIQAMLDIAHPYYKVVVRTDIGNTEYLESIYTVRSYNGTTRVDMNIQQLTPIEKVDGVYVPSDGTYKTELVGYRLLDENNNVIRSGGSDGIGLESYSVALPDFTLSDTVLENVHIENDMLTASIKDMTSFAGWDITCSDASVVIISSLGTLSKLIVTYTDSGSRQVTVTYEIDPK